MKANEAFVEFLSCFDLNAATVESETAIEIKPKWQRNATYNVKYTPNNKDHNKYKISNSKPQAAQTLNKINT